MTNFSCYSEESIGEVTGVSSDQQDAINMLAHDGRWHNIGFVYTEPPQEYINNELKKYQEILVQFCQIAGLDVNRVEVNVQALKDVIIRVDMRQLYFQIYHANMEANEYKCIVGLAGFWLLKLRPFWIHIQEGDSPEMMQMATWINEKFVLHMVCSLLEKFNPEFFEYGLDMCEAYCSELIYSFRYRDLSKESMFLLFDPFYFMGLCNTSITKDGVAIV